MVDVCNVVKAKGLVSRKFKRSQREDDIAAYADCGQSDPLENDMENSTGNEK